MRRVLAGFSTFPTGIFDSVLKTMHTWEVVSGTFWCDWIVNQEIDLGINKAPSSLHLLVVGDDRKRPFM
ncbi:unnamed protein product [Larinioides sclopetarius]|uniref:Uncharacterized protein n=1 Tax=Larinioides sclopetarius TaxID=280406 RepID=A0AAV2B1W1_9ARAC